MSKKNKHSFNQYASSFIGSLKQNISNVTEIYQGSTLGRGIYSYDQWLAMGESNIRYGASAARACLADQAISRTYEDQIVDSVLKWHSEGCQALQVVTVTGKRGTGLTWCLYRAAEKLTNYGWLPEIYVVDDPKRFSQTDLEHILNNRPPAILIIDDADIQDALRPLEEARYGQILAVCSGASSSVLRVLGMISTAGPARNITLPYWPQTHELEDLIKIYGEPQLSHADRRFLRRGTIRSAARRLGSGNSVQRVAGQIVKDATQEKGKAMELLLTTTSLDVLIPQSLVLRSLSMAKLPDKALSWTQRRPYLELNGEEAALLWIEDQETAQKARRLLDDIHGLDSVSRSMLNQHFYASVVSATLEENLVGESDFIRQLLRALPRTERRKIIHNKQDELRTLIGRDGRHETILNWFVVLNTVGHSQLALDATDSFALDGSLVNLLLIMSKVDSRTEADQLIKHLNKAPTWDLSIWTQFFELLQHAPRALADSIFPVLITIIRAHSNPEKILTSSNSLQILLNIALDCKDASSRNWLLSTTLESNVPLHLAPYLFELTARCITQSRSGLALHLLRSAAKSKSFSRMDEEYARIFDEETAAERAYRVIEWCSFQLDSNALCKWTVRATAIQELLTFAQVWVPNQLGEHWDRACMFLLSSVESDVNRGKLRELLKTYSYTVARNTYLALDNKILSRLLSGFESDNVQEQEARRYLQVLIAIGGRSGTLGHTAVTALSALFGQDEEFSATALNKFNEASASQLGLAVIKTPKQWLSLDDYGFHVLKRDLISALDNSNLSLKFQVSALNHMIHRWGGQVSLRNPLLYAAMRLNVIEDYPDLIKSDGNVNDKMMAVAAFASQKDEIEATKLLKSVLNDYREYGEGAHLHAAHQASSKLAHISVGSQRRMYILTSRLVFMGPLMPMV